MGKREKLERFNPESVQPVSVTDAKSGYTAIPNDLFQAMYLTMPWKAAVYMFILRHTIGQRSGADSKQRMTSAPLAASFICRGMGREPNQSNRNHVCAAINQLEKEGLISVRVMSNGRTKTNVITVNLQLSPKTVISAQENTEQCAVVTENGYTVVTENGYNHITENGYEVKKKEKRDLYKVCASDGTNCEDGAEERAEKEDGNRSNSTAGTALKVLEAGHSAKAAVVARMLDAYGLGERFAVCDSLLLYADAHQNEDAADLTDYIKKEMEKQP